MLSTRQKARGADARNSPICKIYPKISFTGHNMNGTVPGRIGIVSTIVLTIVLTTSTGTSTGRTGRTNKLATGEIKDIMPKL
jgi:hypothetical protein